MTNMTNFDVITRTVLAVVVVAHIIGGVYLDYRFNHPGPLSAEAQAIYEDITAADAEGYFDLEPEPCERDMRWCR